MLQLAAFNKNICYNYIFVWNIVKREVAKFTVSTLNSTVYSPNI